MSVQLDIKPGIGLSALLFGATMSEAEKVFGKPEEVELLDDIEDCQATVWHYWENGFTLFFDEQDLQNFNCAEIDAPGTLLWGKEVFRMNQEELIQLFKSKGFTRYETEEHEWGESRLSFDAANIDFYFEKNKLCSVNYGKPSESSTLLILPN